MGMGRQAGTSINPRSSLLPSLGTHSAMVSTNVTKGFERLALPECLQSETSDAFGRFLRFVQKAYFDTHPSLSCLGGISLREEVRSGNGSRDAREVVRERGEGVCEVPGFDDLRWG